MQATLSMRPVFTQCGRFWKRTTASVLPGTLGIIMEGFELPLNSR
jgi:hypothetical protein